MIAVIKRSSKSFVPRKGFLRMKQGCLCLMVLFAVALMSASDGLAQEYALKDLYQQALKNSEKIKFAEENLYISQMTRKKAWAVLMPRVTAYGTYNRFSEDKYSVSGILIQPEESGTWGVRADQAFSMSARELDALKMAGQSITKSEFDLTTAKSDFILAVASSYYDVLKARKGLEIAAANVERLTQYRHSVAKRVKVGELTKTALLRADGELSGARADYLRATNALTLSRAALVRITGVEETFRLKAEETPSADVDPFENIRRTAIVSRADLKSYEMQTQMAGEQVKYARGAFWPNVGLFAVYNGADQNPTTASLLRESVLAGVSLNFPFFEGGLRIAELKEARAKERQARLAYDDLKKNVDIELQGAYLDLETQKGTLKFLEDQLVFAEDNYHAVLRQYDNGLATSLDVMDANALLLSSERNAAEALYGYQLAHLKVRRASGTLLEFIALPK
jgi:outer membrane protein